MCIQNPTRVRSQSERPELLHESSQEHDVRVGGYEGCAYRSIEFHGVGMGLAGNVTSQNARSLGSAECSRT